MGAAAVRLGDPLTMPGYRALQGDHLLNIRNAPPLEMLATRQ